MNSKCRIAIVFLVLLSIAAGAAWAEISVRVDRRGTYMTTLVIPLTNGDGETRIWETRGPRTIRRGLALNPYGDEYGDSWPVVVENSVGRLPWVVWSRLTGRGSELVYSYWGDRGWAPVRSVSMASPLGDNVDPSVGFDSEGRPYLTWWAEDEDKGKVYVSVFLNETWMTPVLVSDNEIDSRYPEIAVLAADERSAGGVRAVRVVYDTIDGRVRQDVTFSLPVTITDDINPMGIVHRGEPVPVSEQDPN